DTSMNTPLRHLIAGALVAFGCCFGVCGDDRLRGQAEPATDWPQAPEAAQPLHANQTVLLDVERKRLLLKAEVVQREALLEMFLCKSGTKEHETIVALDADAYVVHAGLLAMGATPGEPVHFQPEYKPP